ncbi:MAG: tetratricopeptide repeat protein [Flavobacteriales bacterium]|nr:tetratricopeptide repeat protein [Flavobacteriales bacterium]
MKKSFLIFLLFIAAFPVSADAYLDSLFGVWQDASKPSEKRLAAMLDYAWDGYLYSQPDSAYYFAQQLIDFAKKENLKVFMADGLNIQGLAKEVKGDYVGALTLFYQSKKLYVDVKDSSGIAAAWQNIGSIYEGLGDYSRTLSSYQESMLIYGLLKNKSGMASANNNIGIVYKVQGEYPKALEYFEKGLVLFSELNNQRGIANALQNIGTINYEQKKYPEALENYNNSLSIYRKLGDAWGEAAALNNLGSLYQDQDDHDKALDCYNQSLSIREALSDNHGLAQIFHNIGNVYNDKGEYPAAISWCNRSLTLAGKFDGLRERRDACKCLFEAYQSLNNSSQALAYHIQMQGLDDSLQSVQTFEILRQMEFQSQLVTDSLVREEEKLRVRIQHDDEIHEREIAGIFFLGVGLILLFVVIVLFARNRETRKARDEVARYAKGITDSIQYAKRIQNAIFPDWGNANQVLPNSFVFFKPKDLVSGDFYFADKIGDKTIFCAVDCTGHGVPGAFMSIVANNLLTQAVRQEGLTKPSDILEYLSRGVTNTLHQTYEESSVKDGVDIALCCWDRKNNMLEYAGAYNPLFIYRDGELLETKGDKFSCGNFLEEEIRKFTNHEIPVKKGDMLYVFSDGYADQFGGPNGKKFMAKQLRTFLQSIHTKTVEEQHILLEKQLMNWKGNLEQVDDIVVMGVRIP